MNKSACETLGGFSMCVKVLGKMNAACGSSKLPS